AYVRHVAHLEIISPFFFSAASMASFFSFRHHEKVPTSLNFPQNPHLFAASFCASFLIARVNHLHLSVLSEASARSTGTAQAIARSKRKISRIGASSRATRVSARGHDKSEQPPRLGAGATAELGLSDNDAPELHWQVVWDQLNWRERRASRPGCAQHDGTGIVSMDPAHTPAADAQFAPLRLSTALLPERDRIPIWREELGRNVLRLDIEALSEPFHAEATLRALPGLRTFGSTSSAMRLDRPHAFTTDGDDSLGLVINLTGDRSLAQRGEEVGLGAGDGVLLLHEEPAALTCTEGSHLGLVMPRAALAGRVKDLDGAML